jgi:hypothetical protein
MPGTKHNWHRGKDLYLGSFLESLTPTGGFITSTYPESIMSFSKHKLM